MNKYVHICIYNIFTHTQTYTQHTHPNINRTHPKTKSRFDESLRVNIHTFNNQKNIKLFALDGSFEEFNHVSTTMMVFAPLQNLMPLCVFYAFQINAPKE